MNFEKNHFLILTIPAGVYILKNLIYMDFPLDWEERLDNACTGKTYMMGGLNLEHLKAIATRDGIPFEPNASRKIIQNLVCTHYGLLSIGASDDRQRLERQQAERQQAERQRQYDEQRFYRQMAERKRIDQQRTEKLRVERQELLRYQDEQKRLRDEKQQSEKRWRRERVERDRAEWLQHEKVLKQPFERQQAEWAARVERQRVEKQQAERQRVERWRAERQRAERQQAERKKVEKQRVIRQRGERRRVRKQQRAAERQQPRIEQPGRPSFDMMRDVITRFRFAIDAAKQHFQTEIQRLANLASQPDALQEAGAQYLVAIENEVPQYVAQLEQLIERRRAMDAPEEATRVNEPKIVNHERTIEENTRRGLIALTDKLRQDAVATVTAGIGKAAAVAAADRAARQRAERDRAVRQRTEQERAEQERVKQERAERQRAERQRAERQRAERQRAERQQRQRSETSRYQQDQPAEEPQTTEQYEAQRIRAIQQAAEYRDQCTFKDEYPSYMHNIIVKMEIHCRDELALMKYKNLTNRRDEQLERINLTLLPNQSDHYYFQQLSDFIAARGPDHTFRITLADNVAVDFGGVTRDVFTRAGRFITTMMSRPGNDRLYFKERHSAEFGTRVANLVISAVNNKVSLGTLMSYGIIDMMKTVHKNVNQISLDRLLFLYDLDNHDELMLAIRYIDEVNLEDLKDMSVGGLIDTVGVTMDNRFHWLKRYVYWKLYGSKSGTPCRALTAFMNRFSLVWRHSIASLREVADLLGSPLTKEGAIAMITRCSASEKTKALLTRYITEADMDKVMRLLIFITGSVDTNINIGIDEVTRDVLPVAHTCSKRMELYRDYRDYESFEHAMNTSLASFDSFGLA